MAKVHIALVGKQPAPVCNGILMSAPDKVVYIYSKESIDTVEKLKEQLPLPDDPQTPLDALDPYAIQKRAELLSERYKDDSVMLNISSGPKSWSHIFGVHFSKCPNAEIIYIDQNSTLWNYTTGKHVSGCPFDMRFLLRLYGNTPKGAIKIGDYTDKDAAAQLQVENMRNFSPGEFKSLTTVLSKENKHKLKNEKFGKFTTEHGSYVEWEKRNGDRDAFVRLVLKGGRGSSKKVEIESPHAIEIAFNSGWFEFKIAKILSSWPKSKEIYLNCVFPFSEGNMDKNEVDIIVQTENKLLFVECKTQITNNTDIDKFRTVVKGYGGTASKALFVTDAKMNNIAKEKCKEFGILTFSLDEPHCGMNNEAALNLLLDSDLYKTNIE